MAEEAIKSQTRVAVLGTLSEFHQEPIPYNLTSLIELVTDLHPDLLCLDMTPLQWQQRDFQQLPPEYREALLPLANQTDIVVVPIGGDMTNDDISLSGWRKKLQEVVREGLAFLQRTAPGPAAINHGVRHETANVLYHTIAWLTGKEALRSRDTHVEHLTHEVLGVVQRDPEARVLVVVNVQFCHRLRPKLRKYPNIQVVKYSEL